MTCAFFEMALPRHEDCARKYERVLFRDRRGSEVETVGLGSDSICDINASLDEDFDA